MNLSDRILAFKNLGEHISSLDESDLAKISAHASAENGWFDRESVEQALSGIAFMLQETKLDKWTDPYELDSQVPRIVGIVMAGNIPLVGFHDLLSVLISGNFAAIKPSSNDQFLTTKLIEWLIEIEPRFKKSIEVREKLTAIDMVIATGSDNTARYFEYYFKHLPSVIRKNRTSVAVLTGEERNDEIEQLGNDIFSYFGLGCRNVSKVFTPKGFDWTQRFPLLEKYESIINHHKYRNNYDYHKSIYLVNKTPHLDNGFLLTVSTDDLVSPISVLYHQEYESAEHLDKVLKSYEDKIQCTVGKGYIPFGTAQKPELWDYADNIDTLKFLSA